MLQLQTEPQNPKANTAIPTTDGPGGIKPSTLCSCDPVVLGLVLVSGVVTPDKLMWSYVVHRINDGSEPGMFHLMWILVDPQEVQV